MTRAAAYAFTTVGLVGSAFFVGVFVSESGEPSGAERLSGLAGAVVAFWTFLLCLVAIIVIEGVGAARRIKAKRQTAGSP